jgi:uncharacterized membrane protein YsdA (DUF1294 family)
MSNGRIVLLAALVVYALMSLITFAVYGFDKSRAARGGWRVCESHLHALSLLGGWPGALIGQQVFRHKRRKLGFMVVTLLIVALHAAAWWWLWSRQLIPL